MKKPQTLVAQGFIGCISVGSSPVSRTNEKTVKTSENP